MFSVELKRKIVNELQTIMPDKSEREINFLFEFVETLSQQKPEEVKQLFDAIDKAIETMKGK